MFIERDVGGLDGELAAVRHGVARIHGQVHDDLLDLSGIGLDGAEFGAGHHDQVDVLADQAREHLQVFGDDFVQVDDLRRQHLLAAEGEQLARKRGGAFGGAGDFLSGTAKFGVGRHALEQEFRVAGDHHQQVIEVVRDASGETADGFHFLRLAELLLEGAALGDVLGEDFVGGAVLGIFDGAAGHASGEGGAVLANPLGDEAVELFASAELVGEFEPFLRVGVESSQMTADDVVRVAYSRAWRRAPDSHP